MDMSDEELEKQFSKYKKEIIKCMRKVVYKHDLESLTQAKIRREIERRLKYPVFCLEANLYKEMIKQEVEKEIDAKVTAQEQGIEISRDESSSSDNDSESADNGTRAPIENNLKKQVADTKKKKRKIEEASKSEKQIKVLKRYILKCGVRKTWSKELAGMSELQSIEHLKKILRELGVKGKPSSSKCESIKIKLETERELADLAGNQILGDDAKRNRRRKAQLSNSYDVDRSSETEVAEDEENKPFSNNMASNRLIASSEED